MAGFTVISVANFLGEAKVTKAYYHGHCVVHKLNLHHLSGPVVPGYEWRHILLTTTLRLPYYDMPAVLVKLSYCAQYYASLLNRVMYAHAQYVCLILILTVLL